MSLKGTRILLVEDAPDIREVFTVLLRVEGAEVVPAATGREAAEAASRRPPTHARRRRHRLW